MSLTLDMMFKGILVKDAVCTIQEISIATGHSSMGFSVYYTAPGAEESFHSEYVISAYDLNGPNPLEQAFAYLKTLPAFSEAKES